MRFPPTVHGAGDHGFLATLVSIARLAVESAPPGAVLHAVAEEGVPNRDIAEAIGRGLGLPVMSVPAGTATDHFGWLGRFFGADVPASSALTREKYGWTPTGPDLITDLDAGHYLAG